MLWQRTRSRPCPSTFSPVAVFLLRPPKTWNFLTRIVRIQRPYGSSSSSIYIESYPARFHNFLLCQCSRVQIQRCAVNRVNCANCCACFCPWCRRCHRACCWTRLLIPHKCSGIFGFSFLFHHLCLICPSHHFLFQENLSVLDSVAVAVSSIPCIGDLFSQNSKTDFEFSVCALVLMISHHLFLFPFLCQCQYDSLRFLWENFVLSIVRILQHP